MAATNILIVDDRPENLVALEALLEQPDRKIYSAASGDQALRLALEHDFALALLDVEMPTMDGYETAQILRSTKRTRLLPIIFVTAGDRTEERTFRGYESGAIDFLYKPINSYMLKSKVDLFVQLHRRTIDLEYASATLRERVHDLEYVQQMLSDDLRAPLRAISAFTQAIQDAAPPLDDATADSLGRVIKASARMRAMIDDLHELLRVSADAAEPTRFDLEAMFLPEILEAFRGTTDKSGAAITHDPLPKLVANRRLVVQTLRHLVANALQFRGAAPPLVHVGAKRVADAWQISVSDNGVGVPEWERERVFGLFIRLDTTRSGSGVGLALCARAVEKLGGKIWIDSSSAAGSTFCFTVPDASSGR